MSNVEQSEERVESADGLRIFFRSWRPEETRRGFVIIVPGFNAHSGYYTWVAEQFVANGLAVYAVDLRGRGNSDGERFYVTQVLRREFSRSPQRQRQGRGDARHPGLDRRPASSHGGNRGRGSRRIARDEC